MEERSLMMFNKINKDLFGQKLKNLFIDSVKLLIVISCFTSTLYPHVATQYSSVQEGASVAFNTNDFLLPQDQQEVKNTACLELLDTIHFEKIVKKMVLNHHTNPTSPIARALADCLTQIPTEQQALMLTQVTTALQSPESLRVIRSTCAAVFEKNLPQECIVALKGFFSNHRISYFLKFQQALAKAVASYLLQQTPTQPYTASSFSAEHKEAAQSFLSNLLALRQGANPRLLRLVDGQQLIAHVLPVCCSHLDGAYLKDLTAFIGTPAGKKSMLRFEQTERAIYDALIAWCTVTAKEIQGSQQPLKTAPSASQFYGCTTAQSTKSSTTMILDEFKTKYNTIMDKAEEKIRNICGALEKLYLRRFSQNNQTAFKKLVSIAGETFDHCMNTAYASSGQPTSNVQKTNASIKQQDYLALKQLVKSEYGDTCNPITIQGSFSYDASPKHQDINELFELSKFNVLKLFLILIIKHTNPDKDIDQEELEAKVSSLMKQFIATNLTETEIAELKGFFQSSAFQRIMQYSDDFMQIIRENLTPAVIEQLQRVFPWHTIL